MTDTERIRADAVRNEERSAAILAEAERNSRFRGRPDDPRERPRRRHGFRRFKWILRIVLILLAVAAILYFLPRVKAFFTPSVDLTLPDSLSGMLPDEELGYNKIDFSNAVLGESRKKSDFVVLEQDITVTTRVSQALANLALFEKSQTILSYGTGVYTVDLSELSADDITVDETLATVTIRIPHPTLAYVTVDLEKTEYDDTKKALFAFGDIKLTNEQTNLLEQNIDDAMRAELATDEMQEKADAHALSQTQKLFEPVVQSVAPDYIVIMEFGS